MGETTITRGLMEHLHEKLEVEPAWASVIAEYAIAMNRGDYPSGYIYTLGQKAYGHLYTLYDAYAFALMHTAIRKGEYAIFALDVGRVPYSDKEGDEMNAQLAQLAPDVTAKFWGGSQDEDGYIEWHMPMNASLYHTGNGEPELGLAIVPPNRQNACPLEVGTNSFEKTLMALRSRRMLARWPYGSRHIIVITASFLLSGNSDFALYRDEAFTALPRFIDIWNIWNKELESQKHEHRSGRRTRTAAK